MKHDTFNKIVLFLSSGRECVNLRIYGDGRLT